MLTKCPNFHRTAIVTDDPHLAACFSCALARKGFYVAVLDGPRMTRDDADAEVVRRNNALARLNPKEVILVGLSDRAAVAMAASLPRKRTRLYTANDILGLAPPERVSREPLSWGSDSIGAGVLRALYEGRLIEFHTGPSSSSTTLGKSDHVVICEAGEPLSEVIAANYAFALGAGLCMIPKVDTVEAREILEAYYSAAGSRPDLRRQLQARLRELCGNLPLPDRGSLTFFYARASIWRCVSRTAVNAPLYLSRSRRRNSQRLRR